MEALIDILKVVAEVVVYALAFTYLCHIGIDWFDRTDADLSDSYDYEEGPLRGNEVSHRVPSVQELQERGVQLSADIEALRKAQPKDTYSDLALEETR